jgi:hypothetical protein
MRGLGSDVGDRQRADLVERHRAVAIESFVLGRDPGSGPGQALAGAVLELPRRIGEDRPEPPPPRGADQIEMRGEGRGRICGNFAMRRR